MTAVELGQQLAAYARRKFAPYPGAAVLNGDFIDCPLEPAAYDLVYSATAFHWLPEVGGQNRIYDTVDLYPARNEVSI